MLKVRLGGRAIVAAGALFGLAASAFVGLAIAQDGDPELGSDRWRSGACKQCHGWAGDGVPEDNQSEGISLRISLLSPEQMAEVIKCGRPGTGMPSFRNNAWTDIVPCYGMTARLADGLQPAMEGGLTDRSINGLVAFIFEDFVDQGPVTREYCHEIVGADASRCEAYPTAAEVAAEAGDADHD